MENNNVSFKKCLKYKLKFYSKRMKWMYFAPIPSANSTKIRDILYKTISEDS